jgi:hypothetical protein
MYFLCLKNKIMLFLLKTTFISGVIFCITSHLSVMYALSPTIGNLAEKPVTNIGFPYKYYYQFWTSHAESPNCDWSLSNFLLDFCLIWLFVALFFGLKHKFSIK